MTKGEVQEVIISERVAGMRVRTKKFADDCAKEFADCREYREWDVKSQMLALEGQLAILSEIIGIPTFLTTPEIPRTTEVNQSSCDPCRRPASNQREREEGELSATNTDNKVNQAFSP